MEYKKEYKADKKIQKLFKELRTCEALTDRYAKHKNYKMAFKLQEQAQEVGMKAWALVHKKYPEILETQNLRYSGWGNVVIEISEDKK